jgi:hypothetical protein
MSGHVLASRYLDGLPPHLPLPLLANCAAVKKISSCIHRHMEAKTTKTYNSGYSPVVTHLTTNPPVHCLSTAERTGSSIFSVLWSYVKDVGECLKYVGGGNGWATWGAIHDSMLGSPGPPTSRLQGFWVSGSRSAEVRFFTLSSHICRRQRLGLGLAYSFILRM